MNLGLISIQKVTVKLEFRMHLISLHLKKSYIIKLKLGLVPICIGFQSRQIVLFWKRKLLTEIRYKRLVSEKYLVM